MEGRDSNTFSSGCFAEGKNISRKLWEKKRKFIEDIGRSEDFENLYRSLFFLIF